jgi:hypothetical protein
MKILSLLLIGSLTFYVGHAQDWIWQNPLPQGNNLHCVKFIDSNTGYASG